MQRQLLIAAAAALLAGSAFAQSSTEIYGRINLSLERQDVGVTLRVTPQISEGDTLRLEIFQELTAVTDDVSEP